MVNVLIIAPQNVADIPTMISAEAGLRLVEYAQKEGHNVTTLFAIQAERFFLWLVSNLKKIDLVIYLGHGGKDTWYGNNLILPMMTVKEAAWMANKLTYTMSCLSGIELGPALIKNGAISYSGNTLPMLAAFPEPEHNYMEDFINVWMEEPKALLKGITAYEAYLIGVDSWSKLGATYKEHETDWENADWYIEAVEQNRDYHIFLGKKESTVNSK